MADILLVEDKVSLRCVLRLTLESAGYSVIEAVDGSSALNEIATSRHQLMVTDLRIPNGSGLVERRKIVDVLEPTLGNKSETAEDLSVSYKTLLTNMKEYAL